MPAHPQGGAEPRERGRGPDDAGRHAVLTTTFAAATPNGAAISGTAPVVANYGQSRMRFFAELGGFFVMPTGAHPGFFVRTS